MNIWRKIQDVKASLGTHPEKIRRARPPFRFQIPEDIIPGLRELRSRQKDWSTIIEAEDVVHLDYGLGPASFLAFDGRVLVDPSDWDGEDPYEVTDRKQAFSEIIIGAEVWKAPELLRLLPGDRRAPPTVVSVKEAAGLAFWTRLESKPDSCALLAAAASVGSRLIPFNRTWNTFFIRNWGQPGIKVVSGPEGIMLRQGRLALVILAAFGCSKTESPGKSTMPEAERLYRKGTELLDTDPTQAIDFLTKSLELKPDAPPALYNRAAAYARVGRDTEAVADLDRLERLAPDLGKRLRAQFKLSAGGYTSIAEEKYKANLFEEAIQKCDSALAYNPQWADAWVVKGLAYQKLNDSKKA